MGVAIPVGYGQFNIQMQTVGSPKVSVFTIGYKDTFTTPGPRDPAEQALALFDILRASGRPLVATAVGSDWQVLGVAATWQDELGSLVGTAGTPYVGTSSAASPPSNCAVLIRKVTSRGGRKGRGRMFLPAGVVGEANVSANGTVQSPQITAMQSAWNSAYTAMVAADLIPYLLHEDGTLPNAINSFAVQSVIATQRRRMRS